MAAEITLQCRLNTTPAGVLELRYILLNGSSQTIFAFSPLPEYRNQRFEPAPNRIYVEMGPGGLLTLSKRLWEVPESIDVYMPEVPFLTRVPAYGRLAESVTLPRQIKADHPYMDDAATRHPQRSSSSVQVVIGYVAGEAESALKAAPGFPGVLAIDYGPGITHQQLVKSDPVPHVVNVTL
jgi:hypothetical protein